MTSAPAPARQAVVVSSALVLTLAIQSAVPPFGTDMYTPAFPEVTRDLSAPSSLVGLTLTLFFVGFGFGQLVGGPVSDRFGRRLPMIVGGVVCTLGAVGCALAPSIGALIALRLVQGFGGGVAATVARAVVVDVARGAALARVLSVLMALGGLAPAVAPVIGGLVLTLGGDWRVVFWLLAAFGLLMTVTAATNVPESLPPAERHRGGLGLVLHGFGTVLRVRSFLSWTAVATFSIFAMIAYVSNASYVLQGQLGLTPLPYSLFFASTALAQVALSILNARLVGRIRPQRLILVGLALAGVGATTTAIGIWALGSPLIVVCAGFLTLMASQGLVFGNASALAAAAVPRAAGAASGAAGVAQSVAMAAAAPLATLGGTLDATPMVLVMLTGVATAAAGFALAPRRRHDTLLPRA